MKISRRFSLTLILLFAFAAGAQAQKGNFNDGFHKTSFSGVKNTVSARPRVVENAAKAAPAAVLELERQTFRLINEKRKEMNLAPLAWSDDAARVAREHSQNMAQFKFFSHAGLDGAMIDDRADRNGLSRWRAIGENIAFNRGYQNPIEFAVERWMQSPKHKQNLLDTRWKESAVGIAVAADGSYYFTQVFLLRK